MSLNVVYKFVSLNLWGNLPSHIQRVLSKLYASIYDKPFTKYIIKPYCKFNYNDPGYLSQFRSVSGLESYSSFQDFFTRVYKEKPQINSDAIWPCEGLLCDYGQVGQLPQINIKGDRRNIRTIFGHTGRDIPDNYYFSNVFLHNNNYHRIHAPVSGIIRSVERITGDLVLLRPWVYKTEPSLPAMRNERVNLSLEDEKGRLWYLSIVGGPAVGTIVIPDHITSGASVSIIDEIGLFLLGSTCCLAAPEPTPSKVNQTVYVGDVY